MYHHLRLGLLAVLFIVLLAGCKGSRSSHAEPKKTDGPAREAIESLLRLMQKRLALMYDVARWKWNAQQPIHDPEREQKSLADILVRAEPLPLNAGFVREFFASQMEAARSIQEYHFQQWKLSGQQKFENVPDLKTVQRPQLDQLNGELLTALQTVAGYLEDDDHRAWLETSARDILSGDGITDDVRDIALRSLVQTLGEPSGVSHRVMKRQ